MNTWSNSTGTGVILRHRENLHSFAETPTLVEVTTGVLLCFACATSISSSAWEGRLDRCAGLDISDQLTIFTIRLLVQSRCTEGVSGSDDGIESLKYQVRWLEDRLAKIESRVGEK